MFGLTIEKLFVVAVFAGIVIGPRRLTDFARGLGDYIRALRSFVEVSRTRAETELRRGGRRLRASPPHPHRRSSPR